MSLILNIETSTHACSVALAQDGVVLAFRENREDRSHSVLLTVFIEEVMKECGVQYARLDAVAVSKGPGSYTGLRIGVSTAKGLCYALGKPLISLGTLDLMAWQISDRLQKGLIELSNSGKNNILLCPMIDARRMEVYTALYKPGGTMVQSVSATIVEAETYLKLLEKYTIVFFGDGSGKCMPWYEKLDNAVFLSDIVPSASYMAMMALDKFNHKQFEEVISFEPYYLKDFIAVPPRTGNQSDG